MRLVPTFSGLLLLTACGVVPIQTALKLAALDPLSADPAGMAVALDLPEGVGIALEGAMLSLSAETADGVQLTGRYGLVQNATGIWRVAPEDRARLRADQAQAAEWERADPDGTRGSFNVSLSPCIAGAGPAADARLSASLQLEPDGPFLPLLRRVPLSNLGPLPGASEVPPCGSVYGEG